MKFKVEVKKWICVVSQPSFKYFIPFITPPIVKDVSVCIGWHKGAALEWTVSGYNLKDEGSQMERYAESKEKAIEIAETMFEYLNSDENIKIIKGAKNGTFTN